MPLYPGTSSRTGLSCEDYRFMIRIINTLSTAYLFSFLRREYFLLENARLYSVFSLSYVNNKF